MYRTRTMIRPGALRVLLDSTRKVKISVAKIRTCVNLLFDTSRCLSAVFCIFTTMFRLPVVISFEHCTTVVRWSLWFALQILWPAMRQCCRKTVCRFALASFSFMSRSIWLDYFFLIFWTTEYFGKSLNMEGMDNRSKRNLETQLVKLNNVS